jgi:alpha-L-fucosidase
VLNWTGDKLALPAIPARIVRASVLGGGAAHVEQSARGIEIFVPAAAHDDMDTVVALQLDSPAAAIAPVR